MMDNKDLGGIMAHRQADRAGGPTDPSQSSLSRPEALIPCAETPIDRLSKIMRRFQARDERNDTGPMRGLGEIRQAHGGTKDEVRGLLIELVARGDVEALICTNGTYWCARRTQRPAVQPKPRGPKTFVLQAQIHAEGFGGCQWFDAETFETMKEAQTALEYRRWAAQARIDGWGGSAYTMERPQKMRVIQLVGDSLASATEAGTAETAKTGSVHDGAGLKGDAPPFPEVSQ